MCNHTTPLQCFVLTAHFHGVVDVSPSSCLCQVHQKEALSHLKQWPKDEEGEPAQKKGRREEGEMTFMEPRGEIQVCACVCVVCVCLC